MSQIQRPGNESDAEEVDDDDDLPVLSRIALLQTANGFSHRRLSHPILSLKLLIQGSSHIKNAKPTPNARYRREVSSARHVVIAATPAQESRAPSTQAAEQRTAKI